VARFFISTIVFDCVFFSADFSPIKGLPDSGPQSPESRTEFCCTRRKTVASLPLRFTSSTGGHCGQGGFAAAKMRGKSRLPTVRSSRRPHPVWSYAGFVGSADRALRCLAAGQASCRAKRGWCVTVCHVRVPRGGSVRWAHAGLLRPARIAGDAPWGHQVPTEWSCRVGSGWS